MPSAAAVLRELVPGSFTTLLSTRTSPKLATSRQALISGRKLTGHFCSFNWASFFQLIIILFLFLIVNKIPDFAEAKFQHHFKKWNQFDEIHTLTPYLSSIYISYVIYFLASCPTDLIFDSCNEHVAIFYTPIWTRSGFVFCYVYIKPRHILTTIFVEAEITVYRI